MRSLKSALPKNSAITALLAGGLGMMASATAQTPGGVTLDDFTTGPTKIVLSSTPQQKGQFTQSSHILGGARYTLLGTANGDNPFGTFAAVQINGATASAPAALAQSNGFHADSVLQVAYGIQASAGGTKVSSLGLNLTPYNRFRVHFYGISGGADFIIQAYTGSNYTQWTCSLAQSQGPVVVDFDIGTAPAGGANFAAVDSIVFESIDSGAGLNGNNLGITRFEFVPASAAAADVTCSQPGTIGNSGPV